MNETPDQPIAQGTRNQPSVQGAPVDRGPYRVVIVDDHAMFRTGVKAEIGRSVAVVGEAADADRAIAVVLRTTRKIRIRSSWLSQSPMPPRMSSA